MTDHKHVALDRLETGLNIHNHDLKMEHFAIAQVEANLAVLAAVEAQAEALDRLFRELRKGDL